MQSYIEKRKKVLQDLLSFFFINDQKSTAVMWLWAQHLCFCAILRSVNLLQSFFHTVQCSIKDQNNIADFIMFCTETVGSLAAESSTYFWNSNHLFIISKLLSFMIFYSVLISRKLLCSGLLLHNCNLIWNRLKLTIIILGMRGKPAEPSLPRALLYWHFYSTSVAVT